MKHYTPDELKTVLDAHQKWLRDEDSGSRADLSGADLSEADLSGADLSGAYLSGADLSRAYLSGANLSEANLSRAYLSGANLSEANLSGANLSRADLSEANLSGANLSRADLSGADLSRAYLSGADLSGAQGSDLALAMGMHIPPEGPFWAWKKCRSANSDVIVKLLIPAEARRSHGSERKCRAEYADVLEVIGATEATSSHDRSVKYRAGERVTADSWDEDRWETCSHGIHFFITRPEAENYCP